MALSNSTRPFSIRASRPNNGSTKNWSRRLLEGERPYPMGTILWREFVPASPTLLALLLVVSRFVFIQACRRYQWPNDERCVMASGGGIGSMGAGVDSLIPAFAHRVLIWLATFENDRVQSRNLDPALCQFPLQSSDQLLAFVFGSESECKSHLFPPSSVPSHS